MMKKESQNFRLKLKLPAIFKSPFSRRGKKNVAVEGEAGFGASLSHEDVLAANDLSSAGAVAPPHRKSDTDATSTARGSAFSIEAQAPQLGPITSTGSRELGSTDGRSPAPSQARSHRQSMTKASSGENVRVSITLDTIKQQLNDNLQIFAEFKKSLRPSSDLQRYDEAVGSLEGAAKGLATLKSKLSNRKLAGNPNRNSYVLPPPDLKVDFEDTPFSMTIPGIEQSKESTLDVVQENKENEAREEAQEKDLQQMQVSV
ncbi:hypothetical protein AN958_04782 [Leucoagaricus sp. SymC.cos]|nr:hypothetical protein AN958_04782 [Leucoagaricus sp. SymC.cos]